MNDDDRIWELLRRGGMHPVGDGQRRGSYDGTRDPDGVEALGRALAEALAPHQPTAVMVWEGVADAVLAHVVARELGAQIVLAFDADGLVAHSGSLERGGRVVLLTDAVDQPAPLAAMATYARQCGTDVAALALLAQPAKEVLPDIPTVGLVRLSEQQPGPTPDAAAGLPPDGVGTVTEFSSQRGRP